MANKHQVLEVFDKNPHWTSHQIAKHLDCMPEYVRTTLSRNGRSLHRRNRGGEQTRKIDYVSAKKLRSKGYTLQRIADRFGVCVSAVCVALARS